MLIPQRLESGDTVGVVAPSRSLSLVHQKWIGIAEQFFLQRGIRIKFGKNCFERWHETGGTIDQRVNDLMEMFDDKQIQGIITAIGGYNSNQLLEHLDYDVIKKNPKIFLGYSDITALHNAIHAKTGLVTYYGPHFSTLGQPHPLDYMVKYFDETLLQGNPALEMTPSDEIAEDDWHVHVENPLPRETKKNPGWTIVREGRDEGELIGGNILIFQSLVGTPYFPDVSGKVLFLEDCMEATPASIDRALTQMRQAGIFSQIQGLLVGRFPTAMGIDSKRLQEMLLRVTKGTEYPIIAGVDFGHTDPMAILPIGIPCFMDTVQKKIRYLTSCVK
jgi:muramoyltetrapeptide carboxypeptidase